MKTNGNLGLEVYPEDATGWGNGTNENMRVIDRRITLLNAVSKERATEIEAAVAARSADILALVEAGGADYASKAEALKAEIVLEIKEFVDDIVDDHLQRALDNQTAVQAIITTLQTQIDVLESLITEQFNDAESNINTRFNDVSTDLQTKYAAVLTMRDQLLAALTGIAQKLDLHLQNRTNPHRVTFEQAGGSAALRYLSDSDRDGRYL